MDVVNNAIMFAKSSALEIEHNLRLNIIFEKGIFK